MTGSRRWQMQSARRAAQGRFIGRKRIEIYFLMGRHRDVGGAAPFDTKTKYVR